MSLWRGSRAMRLVGRLDGIALALEHLGKIMIGGEQSAGHLELVVVAARSQQDVGDVSPLVRVDRRATMH